MKINNLFIMKILHLKYIGAKETSASLWQFDPDSKLHTREIKTIIKVVGGGPFCK